MYRPLILLLLVVIQAQYSKNAYSQDPTYDWGLNLGNQDNQYLYSIDSDSKGDFYVCGAFEGTVDFDPGLDTFELVSKGKTDLFVAKYSANGDFRWGFSMGNSNFDSGSKLHVDAFDNVYYFGRNSNYDFDPTTATGKASSSNGGFVTKYDSAGNYLWALSTGGSEVAGFSTDDIGNLYLTGDFTGKSDFDPSTSTYYLTGNSTDDVYLSKLDSTGKFVWAKGFGGSSFDRGYRIGVDEDYGVYVGGTFEGRIDFDPSSKQHIVTSYYNGKDAYVAKFDSTGSFKWVYNVPDRWGSFLDGLAVDDSNNVFISGDYGGYCDFDPSAAFDSSSSYNIVGDAYLIKLDSSGDYKWALRSKNSDRSRGFNIETDAFGNCYQFAEFRGNIDIKPGVKGFQLKADGRDDMYVLKVNPAGVPIWVGHLTSTSYQGGIALGLDKDRNLFVGGYFYGTIDLDPDPAQSANFKSAGGADMYIVKFNQCKPTYGTDTVTACLGYQPKGSSSYWTESGSYKYFLTNNKGCDSVVSLELTVLKGSDSTISVIACDSFMSPSNRFTWHSTGVYTDTMKNSSGCDSVLTINLTVNNSVQNNIKLSECDSYKSPSGKYVWSLSGSYSDTLNTKNGCDSVLKIDLTILSGSRQKVSLKSCDSLVSSNGDKIWYVSGTYFDTLVNSIGCDSILEIDAKIGKTTSRDLKVNSCGNYISPSGKVFGVSGNYRDTIPSVNGCDSIFNIELKLNKASSASIAVSDCGSFTSPSGKHVWSTSGTYSDTLVNSKGCDSIITLQLTVNPIRRNSVNIDACDFYTSPSGLFTWTTSGVYNDTLKTNKGCDSIVTINLTITEIDVELTVFKDSLVVDALSAKYQWLDCENSFIKLGGANARSYSPKRDGNYAVEVTQEACVDTSNCYDFVVSSLVEIITSSIKVYPNPSVGVIKVITPDQIEIERVSVFNSIGKEVYDAPSKDHHILIDQHLENGMYIIMIRDVHGELYLIEHLVYKH